MTQNGNHGTAAAKVTCPSCNAALTAGLRFCRMCGYRLGEGVEEYNETRLFDRQTPPGAAQTAGAGTRATDPFVAQAAWGAGPVQPAATFSAAPATTSLKSRAASVCNPSRMGWVGWMILSLAILFAVGGGVKLLREGGVVGGPPSAAPRVAVSVLKEVDGFDTADGGGAFIEGLDGPNTSLERAGLVGGDVITNFDGQPVRDASAMRRILASTPPGKAVPVVFIRDGETKTTTLTTDHERDYRGMDPINDRPGGQGRINVDLGDRVRVPNSNIYGVELDGVNRNGPADLAGLKRGDIVVEFNGKIIRTPGDLRLRIYEAEPLSTVEVVVVRDGQQVKIPVKVGRSRG